MTTENYFETELGFQLTANEASNVLIAMSCSIIYYKKKGCLHIAEEMELTREKVEKQLNKYKNL